jgi:hypothetical protein
MLDLRKYAEPTLKRDNDNPRITIDDRNPHEEHQITD